MRKVTVLRMRERDAQTVLTFRITYVHRTNCTEVVFQKEDNHHHISSVQLNIFLTRISSFQNLMLFRDAVILLFKLCSLRQYR